MSTESLRPGFNWFHPIIIVTCGCLVIFLGFGTRSTMGVFLVPITEQYEWGRSIFAFAAAIQNIFWGFSQPLFGAIADRYGSGRVILLGGICYIIGLLLMMVASSPLGFYIANGILIGLGLSGTSFAVILAVIARAVPEHKRSMALGIGSAAGSLGQFVLVPVANSLVLQLGWSSTILVLACLMAIVIPFALMLKGKQTVSGPEQSLTEALSEAAKHSGYVYLTAGFFVCGFQVTFIGVHLPAYLTDIGLSSSVGAWALSLVGLFNLVGTLLAGYMGNRYLKKNILSIIYFGRAVAIAIFVLMPPSVASALIFASAMGILWLATIPLTSGIVGQIFGPRYLGTLFGFVFLSHQLGSFLGVWMGGLLFDTTQSYEVVWWVCAALGIMAAVLHLPINEDPIRRAVPAAH
ncbi:MAG: MFS transporter [Acidiferrobacterales bacterium]|nr:MFS transporter [Acidiferrobacterales bacterium]